MSIEPRAIKVWDLPTRLFHWGLVLAVIGLVATGKAGGDWVTWHARLGHVAGSLVLFRIAWGFAGGRWSRFTAFPPSPRLALAYLKQGSPVPHVGHSALGALSVYAMLLFLAVQVGTGLASANKDDFAGPLVQFLSNDVVSASSRYHRNIGQWVLIGLVVLHVAAIAYYQWALRRNLTAAMLHGWQVAPSDTAGSRDDALTRVLALALFASCAGFFYWIASLGG